MDPAGGVESLEEIKPPRLEDAGLEDCALPPESIREAFLKAASAVGSIATDSDECVEDSTDVLVAPSKGCVVEKGGGSTGDKVVVGGDAAVAEEGNGLRGLEIGGKDRGSLGKKNFV